jgi:hypothetical protein
MKRSDLQRAADPAGYIAGLLAAPPDDYMGPHETVRTDHYQDHEIVVRTTYRMEIDGREITADLHVGNDGQVSCHAIPVYRAASMLDIARLLIDIFPDDFGSAALDHNDHNDDMGHDMHEGGGQ